MVATLGDDAPDLSTVQKWAADFKRGRESLEDDSRSGRPATTTTTHRVYTFPQLAGQTRLSGLTRLVDYRAPRLHCPSSRIRLASLLARAGQIWPIPTMLREYYGASSFICHAFPRASLSALILIYQFINNFQQLTNNNTTF